MTEIDKIKYHVRLLSEALDVRTHPVASLVISNDWTEADLDAAHDIFEKFDKKLEQSEVVNWYEFEHEFERRFGIGYQGLKSIVLAFFRNDQWTAVCRAYAREHHCLEFSEITREQHQRFGSALEDRVAAIFIKNNIPYSRETNVELGGSNRIRLDFLARFPRTTVAIEVKRTLDAMAIPHIETIANAIPLSKIADELWVVVDQAPAQEVAALAKNTKLKIFTVDDLERKLSYSQ